MPYKVFMDGDKHCVYKHDEAGNKVGDTLGCHDSHQKALDQIAAIEANSKEARNLQSYVNVKIRTDQIERICKPCAEKLRSQGITAIAVGELIRAGFSQGLCDAVGADPGFFTSCMGMNFEGVDDQESFCAEMHKFCTGEYPAEHGKKSFQTTLDIRSLDERIRNLMQDHIVTRSIPLILNSYDEKTRSVSAILATENPTPVFDWERFDLVNEVLFVDGISLPPNNQLPLLDAHNQFSIFSQLGSIREISISDGKQIGRLYFDSTDEGKKAEIKVREGHLTDISLGYLQTDSVWIPEGQRITLHNREFTGPLKVTSKSLAKEGSLTPIGADVYAKIRTLPDIQEIINKLKSISDVKIIRERSNIMDPDKKLADVGTQKMEEEIRREELLRMSQIETIGKKFVGRVEKIDELIEQAKKDGMTVELFKGMIADRIADSKPIFTDPALGLSDKEKKTYSIARAIHAAASGDWSKAKFEQECSLEIAKNVDLGSAPSIRANPKATQFWVPYEVMRRPVLINKEMLRFAVENNLIQRDLNVGTATAGGNLVGTQLLAGQFIELPMNLTLFEKMGARVLNGLMGNIDIPKKTASSTFYYVATEGNAPTESEPTFGKVSLSPKIGGTFTDYTYKLLLQSSPSVDTLVQADLLEVANIGVDKGLFNGSAANGEPRGLINQSGVASVTAANIGIATNIEFLTDIMTGNAFNQSVAWATNPTVWGVAQQREKWLNTGRPLCDENNRMMGYPVNVSNQISSGYLILGDFAQALVGYWGGYSLLVDPYTASAAGTTRVRILVAHDGGVRLTTAFSIASDVS